MNPNNAEGRSKLQRVNMLHVVGRRPEPQRHRLPVKYRGYPIKRYSPARQKLTVAESNGNAAQTRALAKTLFDTWKADQDLAEATNSLRLSQILIETSWTDARKLSSRLPYPIAIELKCLILLKKRPIKLRGRAMG